MQAGIPRGFRDILPSEALLREQLVERVQQCFTLWGYQPVETPTLEKLSTLQAGGYRGSSAFKLFDADGDLLVLRPDVTLPIARMIATRLTPPSAGQALRLRYKQTVFREERSFQTQARAITQLGVEYIGSAALAADVEVLLLAAEALASTGLENFTVALCMVSVLRSLLAAARTTGSVNVAWEQSVLRAWHKNDLVTVDDLARARLLNPAYGQAIAALARLQGGREAIQQCRALIAALPDAAAESVTAPAPDAPAGPAPDAGAAPAPVAAPTAEAITAPVVASAPAAPVSPPSAPPDASPSPVSPSASPATPADAPPAVATLTSAGEIQRCFTELQRLEQVYDLVGQLQPSTEWLVDFSVMSSFDYYTGLVFVAYAPGSGYPLVSGGRYDHTLSQFGAPSAAAGFALNLERVTSALVSELAATDLAAMPPSPPISSLRVDPTALAESFRQVQALHRQGHVASLIAEEN